MYLVTNGGNDVMKNLEYEDGTPSRTWVDDDYNENHLNDKQKELITELVHLELKIQTGKGTLEQFIKDHKRVLTIEKELGL